MYIPESVVIEEYVNHTAMVLDDQRREYSLF